MKVGNNPMADNDGYADFESNGSHASFADPGPAQSNYHAPAIDIELLEAIDG